MTNVSPTYTFRIQTFYRNANVSNLPSGYGRGTTEGDRTVGNTTLRFHEGSHGTHWLNYLRNNPLPTFRMFDGMTQDEVTEEFNRLNQAIQAYSRRMKRDNEVQVDCSGIPISSEDVQCPAPINTSEPTRQRRNRIE